MLDKTDVGRIVESEYARELKEEAIERDRAANDAAIREQLATHHKSIHCGICGSPYGCRSEPDNQCLTCASEKGRRELADIARSKETDADRYADEL